MILAHQLTKRFEDFTALRSLSCEIEKAVFMEWSVQMVPENPPFCDC